MKQRIWLITGISSGLGKALAQAVIATGDFVIGTFRQEAQAEAFNNQYQGKAHALILDLSDPDAIRNVAQIVATGFGTLDVLVNNAGYGLAGAIEETSETELRSLFEANFFGPFLLTQALLPLFRKQRSGHILKISSHGGFRAFPGFGAYNASKFALEGFSEALAQEVKSLGIHLTIVEPGPFRTNFAGRSFRQAESVLPDYDATAGAFRSRMQQVNGQQEGDPAKAAQALIAVVQSENPPLRLPLGKIALTTITTKIQEVIHDIESGRAVAESVVF